MQVKDIEGKTVVLTGKFANLKRAEAEAALARIGATIAGSISKNTDILFAGDKAGSKLAKAKSLGITISDEPTLEALLAGVSTEVEPKPDPAAPTTGPAKSTPVAAFAGKAVALTGTLTTMKRAEAQKLLAEAGATVQSGVTKTTDILVYGDNAGSKLAKAEGMGVTLMTELEMVALLTAGGAGTEELAGATELLAEKQAQDAANATEVTKAVAELKTFVAALKKRKDIQVTQATIGRKAGKAKLDQLRAERVPDALIELYSEMDGVHVEWRFVEPPGGGCIRIPQVTQWTRFTDDESHYMNFGDDTEALLLDEITPEGNTWLVRDKAAKGKQPKNTAMIMFASAAEGADGVIAAGSIAEYLRLAMQNGFVPYWPRCFRENRYVSYAEQEQAIERFKATPVAPLAIRVGARVEFEYFSEGARGEVLALHEAPASRDTEFSGTGFAQVRCDEGSIAWLPQQWLKVSRASEDSDAYERLRSPGFDFAAASEQDLGGLLDELARALDPLASYTTRDGLGSFASNGRRAAGLLATRSLADAVELVLALDAAVTAQGIAREGTRPLAQTGREFNPAELARHRWSYGVGGLLTGLWAGLLLLAHHESARRGVGGNKLLDKPLRDRLEGIPAAAELHQRCTRKAKLAAPNWGYQGDVAAKYGLPSGEAVWVGTGF